MKTLKSRIHYHGGTLPIPAHFQKGKLVYRAGTLSITAKAKDKKYDIRVIIPKDRLIKVVAVEKKHYSSTSYMLEITYRSEETHRETIEIEIRSFGRRGRAQAISRNWAKMLSPLAS